MLRLLLLILLVSCLFAGTSFVTPIAPSPVYDLQRRINETPSGGVLRLDSGLYVGSNIKIDKPITIEGNNAGTIIKMIGSSGYLLTLVKGSELNDERQNHHVHLKNLTLDGDHRLQKVGAILIANTDQSTFENLTIEHFNGGAIHLGSAVRESVIKNIHTRYCGNVEQPVFDIGQRVKGEATNNIYLSDIFIDYSFGTDLYIGSAIDVERAVRRVLANHIFIHGPLPAIQGRQYRWRENELSVPRLQIGNAYDVKVTDSVINVAGVSTPAVVLKSTILGRDYARKVGIDSPSMVVLNGLSISARYYRLTNNKSWDMSTGGAVSIFSGQNIILTNSFFQGNGVSPVLVVPEADAQVLYTNQVIDSEKTL